ncbi:hypothetical protein K3495_g10106 [Podosphaera aphanis]|nr:hypothetical protein K3495_g10106 [Podosphaera aphanis]
MAPRKKVDAPASRAAPEQKNTRSKMVTRKASVVTRGKSETSSDSSGLKIPIKSKTTAAKPSSRKVEPSKVVKKRKAAVKRKDSEPDDDSSDETEDDDETDEEPAPKKLKVSATHKPAPKKLPAPKKPTIKKVPAVKKVPATKKVTKKEAEPKLSEPKSTTQKKTAPKKLAKVLPTINHPPTQRLDIYVFGEGSAGELGLGAEKFNGKSPIDVKRPRLNHRLNAKDIGVVQVAVGGMHCAALTHDNKILTWGVNDQGALGREAAQGGKMKDIGENEASDSEDEEISGLNPNEAEPREIDRSNIDEDTQFAAVFAGDSTTFALTTDGLVYGWGTFRGNDGVLGFRHDIKTQYKPMLIPELKNITNIACGTNHVLALDKKGKVFTWGAGEQNQLARRVVARTAMGALVPREFGLGRKKITHIGCGDYHSFAIDSKGEVYSWGLNTFGQTGVLKEEVKGEEDNTVPLPTTIKSLGDYRINQITGGAHHTLACTESGEVLIWGRIDNCQGGMEIEKMPKESLYFDENDRPRYLLNPTPLPNIKGTWAATANDTCIVIDADGKAYSWGFSSNYQTGQGTDEDVVEATHIDNTAIRDKKLIFSGVGGQFGILGGVAEI